ncbi:FCD domain-containing protein [Streptomyces sp. NBC_00878]|nr:FCD domain-containing protein [Streptomyces sp. NBC_00878]
MVGKAAELAAVRARGLTLTTLAHAANAVRGAETTAASVRLDSRFHLELAAGTRSAALTRAELAARNDVSSLLWIPGLECQTASECADQHLAVVAAIEARDELNARTTAERHLADSMNRLIELRMRLSEEGRQA